MNSKNNKSGKGVIPFRKLSFNNIIKKMSMEKIPPDYYTLNNEDGIIENNLSSVSTAGSSYMTSDCSLNASASYSTSATTLPTHARSYSDGNWSLLRDNSLSSNYETHSSLQYESSSHSEYFSSRNTYHGSNILGERIIGDVITSLPPLVPDQVTAETSIKDNFIGSTSSPDPSSYGSRFPRPKPGESLISFLSSADLYKNCGVLDRENAHFYISEALMAAFEQVRLLNLSVCNFFLLTIFKLRFSKIYIKSIYF